MRVDYRTFVRFNDFHIPLSNYDIGVIEAQRFAPDFVKQRFAGGAGMSDVLNEELAEHLIAAPDAGDSDGGVPLNFSTLIMADPGTTISGADLVRLFEEAKSKGVKIAKLARSLPNSRSEASITPGEGVVDQSVRSGRAIRPRSDSAFAFVLHDR